MDILLHKTCIHRSKQKGYLRLLSLIYINTWPNYIFEDSIYKGSTTKIDVTCKYHGHFKVTSSKLKSNRGCPKCSSNSLKTTEYYKKELAIKHPNISVLEDYVRNDIKIQHLYKTCGHTTNSTPNNILTSSGNCVICYSSGFNKDKPAVLYYLSVNNGTAFKIGITNRTVLQRYSNRELLNITVLKEWYFEDGQEAYDMEQSILKQYKEFKYKGKKLLDSGNTEMFFLDVLSLDKGG